MLATALLAVAAPEASSSKRGDGVCLDEYGRDLCDPAVRSGIRERFGLEPAETLAREGVEGVRVFMVDGYSNDMPVMSVLRRGKQPPVLEVRVKGDEPKVMTAEPSLWTQEVASSLGRLVRESPSRTAPPREAAKPGGKELPVICLHAWTTVVESLKDGKVEARFRRACGDEPIFDGAYTLATQALTAFPACQMLDPKQYRNDSARLVGCAALAGAVPQYAAEVRNRLGSPAFSFSPQASRADVEALLAKDAVLEWPDQPALQGQTEIAAFWKASKIINPHIAMVEADQSRVVATGQVRRRVGEEAQIARFTQEWVRENHLWRIRRWTVEPFTPAPSPAKRR